MYTQYNIIWRRLQINKRYEFTTFKALSYVRTLGWETISLRIHGRAGAVVLPRRREYCITRETRRMAHIYIYIYIYTYLRRLPAACYIHTACATAR